MGTRRKYSPEFKREAVELANQPGQTAPQVARDLGIRPALINRWKRGLSDHGQQAFVGQGVARDEELMRLRRALAQVKKERDFLEDAAVDSTSQRSVDDQRYKKKIVEIYTESDVVYGSRKVRGRCWDLGFQIGRRRVVRMMWELA